MIFILMSLWNVFLHFYFQIYITTKYLYTVILQISDPFLSFKSLSIMHLARISCNRFLMYQASFLCKLTRCCSGNSSCLQPLTIPGRISGQVLYVGKLVVTCNAQSLTVQYALVCSTCKLPFAI